MTNLLDNLRTGQLPLLDYIDQLEAQFDEREPTVFAFVPEVARWERLRRDAQRLLEKYPDPRRRPRLFGLPIGVKDIFHVDGFVTRGGSQLPVERLQGEESRAVTQLREAGALIVGKTITTEFAYFGPGPSRNPHNQWHTPGGSSSGSAAAVGAGMCPLAFGTQTIGSINRPASFCGAVGYKPSYDRISRNGVIPLSPSLDHIGLIGASADVVAVAGATLCRAWSRKLPLPINELSAGIPMGAYLHEANEISRMQFERDCERLQGLGLTIKRIPVMANFAEIVARHKMLMAYEMARFHREWYAEFETLYHEQSVRLIERGLRVDPNEVPQLMAGREQLRAELTAVMDEHGIDLWLTPATVSTAPQGLASTGDPIMQLPWTHSGLPSVNVPSGWFGGLPLSVQVIGRFYDDETLLSVAVSIEQALEF